MNLRRAPLLQRRRRGSRRPHRPVDAQGDIADEGRVRSRGRQAPARTIFGTDYDTPDGTGVRDHIHVEDLASAHLDALRYLREGGESTVLNCGYGHGYSVREVLDAVDRASGSRLVRIEEPRRAGDPPVLVASADRIRSVLGWQPRHDDLDFIVETSLRWERKLREQPAE